MGKLTEQQARFVDEYLIDLNATRAYRKSYHGCKSDTSAMVCAAKLLRNAKVQEYMQSKQQKLQDKTQITQERILLELAKIAFANGSDFAKVVTEPRIRKAWSEARGDFVDTEVEVQIVELKDTDTLAEDKKSAIAEISEGKFGITVKSYDKMKALELLGKHLGMWGKEDKKPGEDDENETGVALIPAVMDKPQPPKPTEEADNEQ